MNSLTKAFGISLAAIPDELEPFFELTKPPMQHSSNLPACPTLLGIYHPGTQDIAPRCAWCTF